MVWDASMGLIGTTRANDDNPAIAWSNDGTTLAIGFEERVKVVDAESLNTTSDFGLGWVPETLAWSGDGTMVAASAPGHMESSTSRFYIGLVENPVTGKAAHSRTFANPVDAAQDVTGMDWTQSGGLLAVAFGGDATTPTTVVTFNKDGRQVASYELDDMFGAKELSWSPNGRYLAIVVGGDVRILANASSLGEVGSFAGHKDASSTSQIDDISWAPDSEHIASTAGDDTVRIWDPHTFEQIGEPIGW